MNSNQDEQTNLIEEARALLSPYIDDQVTSSERALVDSVLAQSPELQDELDSLRQVVSLIQQLPRASAPRPFTLSEADVGRPIPKKTGFWWGLRPALGGLAALAVVLIIGAFLFTRFNMSSEPQQDTAMIAQAPEMAAPASEPETTQVAEIQPMAAQAVEEQAVEDAADSDVAADESAAANAASEVVVDEAETMEEAAELPQVAPELDQAREAVEAEEMAELEEVEKVEEAEEVLEFSVAQATPTAQALGTLPPPAAAEMGDAPRGGGLDDTTSQTQDSATPTQTLTPLPAATTTPLPTATPQPIAQSADAAQEATEMTEKMESLAEERQQKESEIAASESTSADGEEVSQPGRSWNPGISLLLGGIAGLIVVAVLLWVISRRFRRE